MKEWKESTVETKEKMFSTQEYFRRMKETQLRFGQTLGKIFGVVSEELERRETR